jgi:hypothetical protein
MAQANKMRKEEKEAKMQKEMFGMSEQKNKIKKGFPPEHCASISSFK